VQYFDNWQIEFQGRSTNYMASGHDAATAKVEAVL